MEKFAGERELLQSNNGSLQLTSHRIRLDQGSGGHSQTVSMTLDAVASCGLVTRSYPVLLAIALIVGLLGLLSGARNEGGAAVLLFLVAAGFVAGYFVTRSAVMEIRSMGGDKIQVAMKAKRDDIVPFIDAVENAKLALLEGRVASSTVRVA